jgi:hypothetical protein
MEMQAVPGPVWAACGAYACGTAWNRRVIDRQRFDQEVVP